MKFVPTNKKEIKEKYNSEVDFVIVSGDAYVDHPSFGTSLIARYLESFNYKVAILAQPNYNDLNSIRKCGRPRLGFLVGAGNIDSMVNNYYVSKKKRAKDVYSVNGKNNKRPDYATAVYSKMIREEYGNIPIIIGGIEASLRRFAHYDYWQDKIIPSMLIQSNADILVYGMGEKTIIEIADYLNSGLDIKDITFVSGTTILQKDITNYSDYILLPSYLDIKKSKDKYQESFLHQYYNNEYPSAKILIEEYDDIFIVQNPPQPHLSELELDHIYDLPFTYESYDEIKGFGKIPALEEIKFSISINRGCNGACNFCAITFHQGKQVSMRSTKSCVEEANKMTTLENFKGYIHDVGGPTANFNDEMCEKLNNYGSCKTKTCLGHEMCDSLNITHEKYFNTLRELRDIPTIKKVFVRSGIRYDYLLKDSTKYLEELCKHHISGQLRLAPEHVSDNVLKLMSKPSIKYYDQFVARFDKVNEKLGLNQFVVPYIMSSHPGSRLEDALELALYLKSINYRPVQAQDFYPTPATISSLMYYTGKDPFTNKKIFVAKSDEDKRLQQALMQYHLPKNREYILKALIKLNRLDLRKTFNV